MANAHAHYRLQIQAWQDITDGLLAGTIPVEFWRDSAWLNGTGDHQVDRVYYDRVTDAAVDTPVNYDLTALTDLTGAAMAFGEVSLILVVNRRDAHGAYLEVGPGATDGFGVSTEGFWGSLASLSRVGCHGGHMLQWSERGVPVASDEKVLTITPRGAVNNSWDLLILGRSV